MFFSSSFFHVTFSSSITLVVTLFSSMQKSMKRQNPLSKSPDVKRLMPVSGAAALSMAKGADDMGLLF